MSDRTERADRLDDEADEMQAMVERMVDAGFDAGDPEEAVADLRAAAADLRRLDALQARLDAILTAIGDTDQLRALSELRGTTRLQAIPDYLRRIADAADGVES